MGKPKRIIPPGKLPSDLLERLLDRTGRADPRVLLGPAVGVDAAVIDFGDELLVATTDPITFATDEVGWYAVHVNANDVATTGARPRWFLAVLLLPETHADERLAEELFAQMEEACGELGVELCGGHTEITIGIDRPLVIGTMLGEVAPERWVRQDGARPGDKLLLTKGVAIEGTAVLAREHPAISALAGPGELERWRRFLRDPGISVVRDALVAADASRLHAMHDPTEGGIVTALRELARASAAGLRVRREAIPIYQETERICSALSLDPLGLLASGALLIVVAPEDSTRVRRTLEDEGIPVAEIGEMLPASEGLKMAREDGETALPEFARDELARALA